MTKIAASYSEELRGVACTKSLYVSVVATAHRHKDRADSWLLSGKTVMPILHFMISGLHGPQIARELEWGSLMFLFSIW